jgi:hypothetical protein
MELKKRNLDGFAATAVSAGTKKPIQLIGLSV